MFSGNQGLQQACCIEQLIQAVLGTVFHEMQVHQLVVVVVKAVAVKAVKAVAVKAVKAC